MENNIKLIKGKDGLFYIKIGISVFEYKAISDSINNGWLPYNMDIDTKKFIKELINSFDILCHEK